MLNLGTIYEQAGALTVAQFPRSGGTHGRLFHAATALRNPATVEATAAAFAAQFKDIKAETILGIAMGGLVVASELARQTGRNFIYAEKVSERLSLYRFAITKGEHIILIDDTCKTGRRLREASQLVQSAGGLVVGIGVIADMASRQQFTVPFVKLFEL